jgi:hypothetical protein
MHFFVLDAPFVVAFFGRTNHTMGREKEYMLSVFAG